MTDRYTRSPGGSITPILAGAALVLAGYLAVSSDAVKKRSV